MESNSWYWTYFPYLGVRSRHYGDEGWTGEYYIDTVSYGNYNITRAHAAHYHETRGGRVKGKHTFYNHGYWYYRYTDTYWIW